MVVPADLEDLVADAGRAWSDLQDVEGALSQGCETQWSVVFSGGASIFVEHNVENPVEVVLDAPMSAPGVEQLFGRESVRAESLAGHL